MTLFRADQDGTYSSIAHDPNSGDNISPGPNPSIAGNRFSPGATVMELQSYVFFIGQKTGEPSTLYMQTPDNPLASAQPLAANIEQLNFAYGVDTGAATLTFQTAAAVTAAAAWADVRAVRVGIVALSKDDSVSGAATGAGSSYSWDAVNSRYSASNTGADGRLRKSHVFTVAIRGRSSVI